MDNKIKHLFYYPSSEIYFIIHGETQQSNYIIEVSDVYTLRFVGPTLTNYYVIRGKLRQLVIPYKS